jgi:hypothetical protein
MSKKITETVQERSFKYTVDVVFDLIRNSQPKQFGKLKFIDGDIGSDLMISNSCDYKELVTKSTLLFTALRPMLSQNPLKQPSTLIQHKTTFIFHTESQKSSSFRLRFDSVFSLLSDGTRRT